MARSFNGSTDKIDVGTGISYPTSAITMSLWFYWTAAGAASSTFQAFIAGNTAGCGMYIDNSTGVKKIAVYTPVTGGGGFVDVDPGSTVVTTNLWHHFYYTYDTVNGLLTFLDNVSQGTAAANGNLAFGAIDTHIGDDPANAGRNLFGSIADVAIWNIALSSTQRGQLFNGVRPVNVNSANLIGWWPLDGYASPEPDLSGAGNNGTLTGTGGIVGPPPLWRLSA